MTNESDDARDADERLNREAALDETIAQSFPASDPLSTDPNPDAHEPEPPAPQPRKRLP